MFPLSSHYVNQRTVSHGPGELIGHYEVKAVVVVIVIVGILLC